MHLSFANPIEFNLTRCFEQKKFPGF